MPADGFYEWQERGDGHKKRPFHLHDRDGAPLALAGIWTAWRGPDGEADPLYSCAIVTTRATGEMARIHERMPVVLPQRLWSAWLTDDAADTDEAVHLRATVQELDPPRLVARPVSTRVNDVRNDGPELWEPADEESDTAR